MPIIRIIDPGDPRIADYGNVPDATLLRERGLFVAENRLVVQTLLASPRFRTRSVLLSDAAYEAMADVVAPHADLSVYVCPKALMQPITGYHIHRGCLALGERPEPTGVAQLLASLRRATRLVVLEAITNADNVGAIFRNARAFAVDGVVIGPRCCDPLYRKATRVAIGATLVVPYAETAAFDPAEAGSQEERGSHAEREIFDAELHAIRRAGFTVVALTPAGAAIDVNDFVRGNPPQKIALLAGNEGEGLSAAALRRADVSVRIPMVAGIDSINASTATGIVLHRIFRQERP
jgi:tRNA G18 (ribose-2'-O)-methylase SpoU